MGYKIVWTRRAEQGYDKIVGYLLENWTEKEVRSFIAETRRLLSLLEENPGLLEQSSLKRNLRPRLKQIELVNIRSARQKPV